MTSPSSLKHQRDRQETCASRNHNWRNDCLPSQLDSFALTRDVPKEKPNYFPTGLLAAAANTVTLADGSTTTLKYHEPPEARKPPRRDQWRLYVFKDDNLFDMIDIGTRSCWLIGRDASIADIEASHPSISQQHAIFQFRYTEKIDEYGDKTGRVKLYLIDLESANGTLLNRTRIPEGRYIELKEKDLILFGNSTREYIVMLARD